MARMIPAEVPEETRSDAEKDLFPVLRDGLDDGCTVFHSFHLLTPGTHGKFIDGEIDYLIHNPRLGLLVLEVKGGIIRYEGEADHWYQNDKVMRMSPFRQSEGSKHKLKGFLARKLGGLPPCTFGHAVCFPDVFAGLKVLPSGADPDICITGEQLPHIGEVVQRILERFWGEWDRPLSQKDAEKVRCILMPHCEYGGTLRDRIGQAERTIFRLTDEQCRLLDFISGHRQALIEGCAGSGKTVMAVKKARELALEGRRVLLLAYNIMISERLAAAVSDLENVTATNYHGFCMDRLKEAGITPEPAAGHEYWQREVPKAFAGLIERQPIKYDAVIVDEGQDFQLDYWVTIMEMVSEGGFFYIFYDPDQNLFGGDLDFPIDKEPFSLHRNCRNTRRIFDRLELLSSRSMTSASDAPEGEPVFELTVPNARVRRQQVGKILHDLVNNQGIEPDRIVILGGHSIGRTCIGDNPVIGSFKVMETVERMSNVVRYHTYMKFKGCEADAVIMIDVDRKDARWATSEALYTTISRAKHLLYILYADGGIHGQ